MNIIPIISSIGQSSGTPSIIDPVSTRHRVLIYTGQSNGINVLSQSTNLPTYLQGDVGTVQYRNVAGTGWIPVNGTNPVKPDDGIWDNNFAGEINYSHLISPFWQGSAYDDYIIKWTSGGKEILYWMEDPVRSNIMGYINDALAAISADEDDYSVVMYWDQGESDADQGKEAESLIYGSQFETMIADYRANLNVRSLPVLMRKMKYPLSMPWIENLIEQQEWILENVADIHEIVSQDLVFPDNLHFDEPGSIEIGKRIMEKAIYLFD